MQFVVVECGTGSPEVRGDTPLLGRPLLRRFMPGLGGSQQFVKPGSLCCCRLVAVDPFELSQRVFRGPGLQSRVRRIELGAQLPLTDPPVLYGLGLTSNLLGRALRFDLLTQLCGVGVVLEQGERSVDEGERAWDRHGPRASGGPGSRTRSPPVAGGQRSVRG